MNGHTVTYLNSGDWVENLTALEYNWDKWTLYHYDESEFQPVNAKLRVKEQLSKEEAREEPVLSTVELFKHIVTAHHLPNKHHT